MRGRDTVSESKWLEAHNKALLADGLMPLVRGCTGIVLGGLDKLQEWLRDYNAVVAGINELNAFFRLTGENLAPSGVQPD